MIEPCTSLFFLWGQWRYFCSTLLHQHVCVHLVILLVLSNSLACLPRLYLPKEFYSLKKTYIMKRQFVIRPFRSYFTRSIFMTVLLILSMTSIVTAQTFNSVSDPEI